MNQILVCRHAPVYFSSPQSITIMLHIIHSTHCGTYMFCTHTHVLLLDDVTGVLSPVYSKSVDATEMWISLAEKAYAKAVGKAPSNRWAVQYAQYRTLPYILFTVILLSLNLLRFYGPVYQQRSIERYAIGVSITCAMLNDTMPYNDVSWCCAA